VQDKVTSVKFTAVKKLHIDKEHQFPDQTEEKKEEGLRGWWEDVSQVFLLVVYENPINNINRFVLQECGDFTWRVSDCEELVGVTHWRRWWWLSIGVFFVKK